MWLNNVNWREILCRSQYTQNWANFTGGQPCIKMQNVYIWRFDLFQNLDQYVLVRYFFIYTVYMLKHRKMNVIYFLIFYIEFRLDFALRAKPSKMKFIDQC